MQYPEHLLRIGLFDLWIGNNDRTVDNYNLFITRGKPQKLVVFDHFEAFNKIADHSFKKISTEIDVYSDSFLSTNYAYEMLGWVSKDNLYDEMEKFFDTVDNINIAELLRSISNSFPGSWNVDDETIDYILKFLTSDVRLQEIRNQVTDYIKYLQEKQ